MILSEVIENWPEISKLNAESILASPGYAAKCAWPTDDSVLVSGGTRPDLALALRVRFGKNDALLGLPADESCDKLFPNLATVLTSKGLPEALLLAVVENDVAPFFQILEELSEEHLQILGIAPADDTAFENARVFRIQSKDKNLFSFLLTLTPELVHDFGQLKYINPKVPGIGDRALPAKVLLAKFGLSQAELASLAQGDRLLLPECPTDNSPWKVQLIVGDKFLVSATLQNDKLVMQNVPVLWQTVDELGVIAGDPISVTLLDLLQLLQPGASIQKSLADPQHLRLCTLATTSRKLAEGSLQHLGSYNTFAVESIVE